MAGIWVSSVDTDSAAGELGLRGGDIIEKVEGLTLGAVIEQESGGTLSGGTEYAEYTTVTDDTGSISVQVPTSWTQVDGAAITLEDGTSIPNVSAAPDLQALYDTWTSPGMTLSGAGPEMGSAEELLSQVAANAAEACTPTDPQPYDDGLYTGLIQVFTGCGGTGAVVLAIAAQPADGSFTALAIIQLTTEADVAVADKVLETFVIEP